ncbi:LacI family DNA-binding transcriptional regulator [Oceanicella sp. SM1341]|uniref:LacI family DNA-binding transcriptional regulator n=1 Tax=Oceanicella sp. SM1341 TaxID=1548889 RepID=UPI001E4FC0CD|nr:LacI family DNA-binding transcriptional regulator [Oceanicella sp. SM1341]
MNSPAPDRMMRAMDGKDDHDRPAPAKRPASRGVTMEAVGRLAGVSQVTVSRALSDPSKVSPATMERIREAIELTGYVPNALAGALASSRSRLVSALVPSITNVVYASMIQAFGAGIRDSGYQIMLSETGFAPQDEEALVAAHLSRRPDAMLLTGIHHSARTRRMLLGAGIPVVEVWDITDSPIDLCVGFSHIETGRAVADYAADAGHRRAGVVSAGDERARRRMAAFTERFRARTGATAAQALFPAQASLECGREGLARLIEAEGFTGGVVFCSSDLLAHGVLIEAQSRGLDVPGEVAVIGFGDQDFSPWTSPGITTVRVDRPAFGHAAARGLLARLQGGSAETTVIDLGFEIVPRGSS